VKTSHCAIIMKCATLVLAVLLLACYAQAEKWALLVAGSGGYGNYRHQADVCHSYQLLIQHGFKADHIITMMADDIAYNSRNPFKGNIINQPNGPNVYTGVKIDYRGSQVTPMNFLSVLAGDSSGMRGKGSGRVIQSGASDNVFVYYADHGNKNIIGFPGNAGVLYASSLNKVINMMYESNSYKNLVFYIEACFSGSMFKNTLPTNKRVYALTAANEKESSYSCYYDKARRTYLGDEFSVQWMKNSERQDFNTYSLNRQYRYVMLMVRGSHVMQYGDTRVIGEKTIGEFQGGNHYNAEAFTTTAEYAPITDAVPTWDVPYMSLLHQLEDATTTDARMSILREMQEEQTAQLKIKESMESIVGSLSINPAWMMQVQETTAADLHCYEQTLTKYLQSCDQFQQHDYAMKDLHVFANLCNKGHSIESINAAIDDVCQE